MCKMKKVIFSVEFEIQDLTFLKKYFGLDPELVLL